MRGKEKGLIWSDRRFLRPPKQSLLSQMALMLLLWAHSSWCRIIASKHGPILSRGWLKGLTTYWNAESLERCFDRASCFYSFGSLFVGDRRETYFWEDHGVGEGPLCGSSPGCIIYYLLKIIFCLMYLCGLRALVLSPSSSVMPFSIGKQLMWLPSFLFLRPTLFVLGGEMWESGDPILWMASCVSPTSNV